MPSPCTRTRSPRERRKPAEERLPRGVRPSGQSPFRTSATVRTGTGQWLAEAVAAFGLVFTILAGLRFRSDAIPWLVGLYITAAYWFTASTSFANPAVAIARAFSDTFSGIRPVDLPGFIAAELLGALLAMALAGWLFAEPKPIRQMKAAE